MIEILPKLFENLGKARTYSEIIASVWQSLWGVIFLYVIIVALVFYFKYVKQIDIKARKEKAKAFLSESGKHSFLARACLFLLFLLASTLSPMFVYFGLAFAMALLAIVPSMGWFAGMAYIDEVAINDRACTPLPSVRYYQAQKAQLDTKKPGDVKSLAQTVQCVKVVKDDAEIASGRLVLSTSKTVVLYLPDGVARRVPISDAVIEVVDKLPSNNEQGSNPAKSQGEATDKTK